VPGFEIFSFDGKPNVLDTLAYQRSARKHTKRRHTFSPEHLTIDPHHA
jgi:hypothetical protein